MRKPDINKDDLKRNPFTIGDSFKINVQKVTDYRAFTQNDGIIKAKEYLAETDALTKVYVSPNNRVRMSNCSSFTQRLILWIIFKLEPGQDWLWINKKDYMLENHIKDIRTYNKSICELIRYEYILSTGLYRDTFWINPKLFFSGSRVKKYSNKLNVKR